MRKGLTLMELLVVVSILATLAALLFPIYLKVRSRMDETSCANQLRQIVLAIHMYANDQGDGTPFSVPIYPEKLYPQYIRDRFLLICPRVLTLTPAPVMERFLKTKRWGQFGERSTYRFLSPIGLDQLKMMGELPIGFSDVFAKRGDETPIGLCDAHWHHCPWEIMMFFQEGYGSGGITLCRNLFSNPGGPIIVARWGGSVGFIYGYKGSPLINPVEVLVNF